MKNAFLTLLSFLAIPAASAIEVPNVPAMELPAPPALVQQDHEPIRVGNRVHHPSYKAGAVKELFSSGIAKVSFDDYFGYFDVRVETLGRGVNCHRGICRGDRVHDASYKAGKVEEVFSNGIAKVVFDDYFGRYFRKTSGLGKKVACYRGLHAGDRVHDSTYRAGSVVEVFADGIAKVSFDAYFGLWFREAASLGVGVDALCPIHN